MTFATGILAALASPLVMTMGFLVWEDHWKGSAYALNLYKCCTASLGFLVVSLTIQSSQRHNDDVEGLFFPSEIFTRQSVGFLILSSTIGILIGDWTWLQALQLMGARRVILMDSMKPFLAALFGWWLLDEHLRLAALGGIALTVTGILIVSLEQTSTSNEAKENDNQPPNDDDKDDEEELNLRKSDATKATSPSLIDNNANVQTDHVECNRQDDHSRPLAASDERDCPSVDDFASSHRDLESSDTDQQQQPSPTKQEINDNIRQQQQDIRIGYLMSMVNLVLDTYGAVLIKQYGTKMTVWDINLIRFGFAGSAMMFISVLLYCLKRIQYILHTPQQQTKTICESNHVIAKDEWYALPIQQMTRSSWLRVTAGVVLVTFLTPTLSNYALFEIAVGLTLTLTSIGPLYQLPLSHLLQKHPFPSLRSILGAILAVSGIVVLAFRGTIPEK